MRWTARTGDRDHVIRFRHLEPNVFQRELQVDAGQMVGLFEREGPVFRLTHADFNSR